MCDDNASFSIISTIPDVETIYTPSASHFDCDDFDLVSHSEDEPRWDGASSCSTSLTPSVHNFEFAHGRRFHGYKSGRYPLPNDIIEQQREDTKHTLMIELTDGQLFYSDIGEHPQRIIDIGTGSGLWAIDVADLFPSATVIGTDLSPIQPSWLPVNARMYVEDCEDREWLHGSKFDFAHLRSMAGVVKDVDGLLAKIYPQVKTGGWVEFQEFIPGIRCDDGTMKANDPLREFCNLSQDGMSKLGFPQDVQPEFLQAALERAGFINVQCITKKVPISSWPRDTRLRTVGVFMKGMMLETLGAFAAKPLAALGMTAEERRLLVRRAKESLDDGRVHRYVRFCFCFGQKGDVVSDSESYAS